MFRLHSSYGQAMLRLQSNYIEATNKLRSGYGQAKFKLQSGYPRRGYNKATVSSGQATQGEATIRPRSAPVRLPSGYS
jgi:hypothetical protein